MNKYRILAIDGGGIRGIVPGQLLVHLEKYLQEVTRDPQLRISDCFDLIAGTSTGGILTCLYLFPDPEAPRGARRARFSAQQAVDLYLNYGDDIFSIPVFKRITSLHGLADEKYPAKVIEETLATYFGDVRLSQLVKDCAIPAYDIAEREVVIFNSRDNRAGQRPDKDFLVRDVARATSAAPTYFEPANIRALDRSVRPLIDGGVFANNPALCAYSEFVANQGDENAGVRDVALLSLGTGARQESYSFSEVKDWGAASWVKPVIDITLSGVAEVVDYQLRQLFRAGQVAQQYLRIEPALRASPKLDDASIENMRRLVEDGNRAYQDNRQALETFARTYLAAPFEQPAVAGEPRPARNAGRAARPTPSA